MNTPLPKITRRSLDAYLYFRDRPMTLGALFWYNRRGFFFKIAYFLISFGFAVSSDARDFLIFVTALAISSFSRDFMQFHRTVVNWPTLRAVIDWDKVAAKLSPMPPPLPPV